MSEPRELEDAGCEPIPGDLVELHEVLEWQAAVAEDGDEDDEDPG